MAGWTPASPTTDPTSTNTAIPIAPREGEPQVPGLPEQGEPPPRSRGEQGANAISAAEIGADVGGGDSGFVRMIGGRDSGSTRTPSAISTFRGSCASRS